MTTRPSGQLGEELRQLLRRIEEIPAGDAPAEAGSAEAERIRWSSPPAEVSSGSRALAPALRSAFTRRGMRAGPLSVGAVGVVAALATWWSFLLERPNAMNVAATTDRAAPGLLAVQGARRDAAPDGFDIRTEEAVLPVRDTEATKPPAKNSTAVPRTPAPKPSLTVPAISTTPGHRVRFSIQVEPSSMLANGFQVRVRGLPRGARFSLGRFVAPDNWIIATADLGALELALGDTPAGRFEVATELQAIDGRQLAEAKSLLVVTAPASKPGTAAVISQNVAPATSPGAAPQVSQNAAPPISPGDTERLNEENQDRFLAQGLRLLGAGNVASARLLFERAADAGSARAALLLGDTYDDVRLAQLGVQGVLPDRDKANYWYGRADELGAAEAKERISEINSR
jgi:hypothetical protein